MTFVSGLSQLQFCNFAILKTKSGWRKETPLKTWNQIVKPCTWTKCLILLWQLVKRATPHSTVQCSEGGGSQILASVDKELTRPTITPTKPFSWICESSLPWFDFILSQNMNLYLLSKGGKFNKETSFWMRNIWRVSEIFDVGDIFVKRFQLCGHWSLPCCVWWWWGSWPIVRILRIALASLLTISQDLGSYCSDPQVRLLKHKQCLLIKSFSLYFLSYIHQEQVLANRHLAISCLATTHEGKTLCSGGRHVHPCVIQLWLDLSLLYPLYNFQCWRRQRIPHLGDLMESWQLVGKWRLLHGHWYSRYMRQVQGARVEIWPGFQYLLISFQQGHQIPRAETTSMLLLWRTFWRIKLNPLTSSFSCSTEGTLGSKLQS